MRLRNLDYLRGICAIGIMMYHYLLLKYGTLDSSSILARIGFYGVSVFYVLSGLTLHHVYYEKMNFTFSDIWAFFKKRFFRIYPLLILVSLIAAINLHELSNYKKLALNLTGLFGFFDWDGNYFLIGSWSIGNELVFYTMFPLFVFLLKKAPWAFYLLSFFVFLMFIYFSFYKLDNAQPFNDAQWRHYVNPLNQAFLFLGGFLIGYFFKNYSLSAFWGYVLLSFAIILFLFYPVSGDKINLITNQGRLVFAFICFLICFVFYRIRIELPRLADYSLGLLGEISYSIYLFHTLVYIVVGVSMLISAKYFFEFPEYCKIPFSIVATITLSYFVYTYFEKYFIKMGAKR